MTRSVGEETLNSFFTQGGSTFNNPVTLNNGSSVQQGNISNIHQAVDSCLVDLRVTDPWLDKARIESEKGGLLRNSYSWILNDPVFQQWRDHHENQVLWIKGDRGMGKTMLLCGIINELKKSKPNGALSFFFCQANKPRLNNATAVLRGLIYLLLDHQKSLISHVQGKYDKAGKQLFEDENAWFALSEIFTHILQDQRMHKIILVIDAIDECVSNAAKLWKLIQNTTPSAKWIITSRNQRRIEQHFDIIFQGPTMSLKLNRSHIAEAVNAYVRHRVTQLTERKKYDEKTRDAVQDHLLTNCNNNFLWVSLVCENLEKVTLRDTLAKLIDFPAGLSSLDRNEYVSKKEHLPQEALEIFRNLDLTDAEHKIAPPCEGTCEWIFKASKLISWMADSVRAPILCIHGNLGSGKSTLMKHVAMSLRSRQFPRSNIATFFNLSLENNGSQTTPRDIYQSLLAQILRYHSFRGGALGPLSTSESEVLLSQLTQLDQQGLCELLKNLLHKPRPENTIILIDAVEKCTDPDEVAEFFQDLALMPPTARLRICFSSHRKLPILGSQCEYVSMREFNQQDIALFIKKRLPAGNILSPEQQAYLQSHIEDKASGIFLWVVLVINLLRGYLNRGRDFSFLLAALHRTPNQLTELYKSIVSRSRELNSPDETRTMVRVMQWVLFSARPLALDEWHHVFAFIDNPGLKSIEEWKNSETYTQSDKQLLQRIEYVCCGLVDIKEAQMTSKPFDTYSEAQSLGAAAGSLENRQYIDLIHSSAREFFLNGGGFTILDSKITNPSGQGHAYILEVCIRYTFLEEMRWAFRLQLEGEHEDIEEADDAASDSMSLGSSAGTSIRSIFKSFRRIYRPKDESRRIAFSHMIQSTSALAPGYSEADRRSEMVLGYLDDLEGRLQESSDTDSLFASTTSSQSKLVQVDNPPDLWQYCYHMLVHHSVATEKAGVVPERALEVFVSQDVGSWAGARTDMMGGATLAYFAAQWNLVTWLQYFGQQAQYLRRRADLNPQGGLHGYPIIVAAKKDNLEAFEYLMERTQPTCLAKYDRWGLSALHYAAMSPNSSALLRISQLWKSNPGVIKLLINKKDRSDRTALHLAAFYASSQNVEELVRIGAFVDVIDKQGKTPLHLACLREPPNLHVCEILINAQNKTHWHHADDKKALRLARGRDHSLLIRHLATLAPSRFVGYSESIFSFSLMTDSTSTSSLPNSQILQPSYPVPPDEHVSAQQIVSHKQRLSQLWLRLKAFLCIPL